MIGFTFDQGYGFIRDQPTCVTSLEKAHGLLLKVVLYSETCIVCMFNRHPQKCYDEWPVSILMKMIAHLAINQPKFLF